MQLITTLIVLAVLIGLGLTSVLYAGSRRSGGDIVYSARYYKPGNRPSHYKIWRINADGSGRTRLTSGRTEDRSPIWLADGKSILFFRKAKNKHILCTINENGGRVTEVLSLPEGFTFIDSVAPDRSKVVYLTPNSKLFLFDVMASERKLLGAGGSTAWSADTQRLYVTTCGQSKPEAEVLDLATGVSLPLNTDFCAGAWITDDRLVAERFAKDNEQARLVVLSAQGTPLYEITLPFNWEDESDDFSPFADNVFAVPGDQDSVLYGRHAGNSTEGPMQMFYRVNLKEGQVTALVKGRDLAWSPDHQFFLTGNGRCLAPLDRKRRVWVSSLSVVPLSDGKPLVIVRGLVEVEGFDWRYKRNPRQ